MPRRVWIGIAALSLAGCSALTPGFVHPHALIDDVSIQPAEDSGYRVVAVDGKPVARQRGAANTYVPFVVVFPGIHSLRLEPREGADVPPTIVSAAFEAGKRYRIQTEEGTTSVVEATTGPDR